MASIEEMSDTLKLLSDKSRLTILALLKHKEMCVCDIVEILATTQPNVSQHLKKLKSGGLVRETRKSQWIYYALDIADKPYLNPIIEQLPSMSMQIEAAKPQACT
ncbi:ArsR/SmtB family transcription factor [Cohnella sp. GCM10012308]|uniref:ArsR/SmtB family transcription factor n=1 Tax=Cohnella sp. GCM10012308 TaxID=3317329 RepID=UPI0036236545